MELCDASLEDLVGGRYKHPSLNLENPVEIFRQIVQALKYLSKHKMAYRNINPWNILVSKDVIKLADFSISRVPKSGKEDITNSNSSSTKKRKANWTAPEINIDVQRYDVRADIFSTGCVFGYVLLKGVHPFGDEKDIMKNMLKDKAVNVKKILNENARDLVERMLISDPGQRITIDQIEKHPYFWDETMALRFIREVCGLFENVNDDKREAKAKLETKEIRKRIFKDMDWSKGLEQEVVDHLFRSENYKLEDCRKKETFGLLKTIRNKVRPSI
jgi:serine/threonine-protein kinase/endoribonuclease IRE1